MNTNDLINALAHDTAVPRTFDYTFKAAAVCGTAIAGVAFFAAIGPRPDIVEAAGTIRFMFKFVVTLSLAVASTGLVFRLARPGVDVRHWKWAQAVAPALLLAAVVAELLATPESTWTSRLQGTNARMCLTLIPFLATGPLAGFLYALRHGAPEHPGGAGAIAGLAASGVAATLYAAQCTDDSPLFVATWYPVAMAIVVLIGYLAGSRLLRW